MAFNRGGERMKVDICVRRKRAKSGTRDLIRLKKRRRKESNRSAAVNVSPWVRARGGVRELGV